MYKGGKKTKDRDSTNPTDILFVREAEQETQTPIVGITQTRKNRKIHAHIIMIRTKNKLQIENKRGSLREKLKQNKRTVIIIIHTHMNTKQNGYKEIFIKLHMF